MVQMEKGVGGDTWMLWGLESIELVIECGRGMGFLWGEVGVESGMEEWWRNRI